MQGQSPATSPRSACWHSPQKIRLIHSRESQNKHPLSFHLPSRNQLSLDRPHPSSHEGFEAGSKWRDGGGHLHLLSAPRLCLKPTPFLPVGIPEQTETVPTSMRCMLLSLSLSTFPGLHSRWRTLRKGVLIPALPFPWSSTWSANHWPLVARSADPRILCTPAWAEEPPSAAYVDVIAWLSLFCSAMNGNMLMARINGSVRPGRPLGNNTRRFCLPRVRKLRGSFSVYHIGR
ncbi:uncharacterized protein LY79DRAFT_261794 [Colletotrichum navitas]|uniref:Uncharacterized protein n=1 Tax=Colletotrichum navitas TaxID=681940 RepID=A0AAD8V397_9PEZI|nr:uncharacterized protein LY79DRAFT_261794 [Colletotrichum navitas]KAK1585622.1 hypothetical protein LY79DRAFT_261794 [Colletotrichum navitas]